MQRLQTALRELPDAVFVDVLESDDAYRIVADLPGVAPEDVELTVEAGRLSVTGERRGPLAGTGRASDDGSARAEAWVGDETVGADHETVGEDDESGSGDDGSSGKDDGSVDGASVEIADGASGAAESDVTSADEPFEGGNVASYVQRDRARRLELELPLPPNVTGEDATASLDRGVLEVTLPKHSVLGTTDVEVEDA